MRAHSTARLTGGRARVVAVLSDLATWPAWLDVVASARPEAGAAPPAWQTRLGLRVGPLSLGVTVRMVLVHASPESLRFERIEQDGRADHSAVVIAVAIRPVDDDGHQCDADLDLVVDKRIPLLDLQREVDRRAALSRARLQPLIDSGAITD